MLFAILVNRLVASWPCRTKYVDTTVLEVVPRCSPSYLQLIVYDISVFAAERGMHLKKYHCVRSGSKVQS